MANPLICLLPLVLLAPQQPGPDRAQIIQPLLLRPDLDAPRPQPAVPKPNPAPPENLASWIDRFSWSGRLVLEPKREDRIELGDEPLPPGQPPAAPERKGRQRAIARETFDRFVFEDRLGREGTRPIYEDHLTSKGRRAHLHRILEQRIKRLDRIRPLTTAQADLVRLAGTGDIQRFLDRVEAARGEFEAVRQDLNLGMAALLRLEPLVEEYQGGPFGSRSIYVKTLEKMLSDANPGARRP